MLDLNTAILEQVVTTAKRSAEKKDPRWVSRIERAAQELTSNPYIEIVGNHLLIGSPSGNVYESNGVCSCEAYKHNRPCWHRAATQLVYRYQQVIAEATKPETPAQRATRLMNELYS